MNKHSKIYRYLVATALLTSSLFQFVAPVLADGTAAGTSINNTGTATYEDPNNPGTTINATSNQVTVKVAKVAGITVTASGVTNTTSGTNPIKVGDQLNYTYTVTNVGNSPIDFRIPNLATVTGPGTVSGNLQISYDGGKTLTPITSSDLITTPIPAGGSVLVQVPVTVATGANSGDTISVKLGQTPGDAQNQPRTPDGGDVYTVDDSSTSTLGAPVNGTREASVTQKINVGNTPKDKALATLLLTRTGYDNNGTSTTLTDDVLTYGLSLRVEQSDVTNTALTPAPLVGTTITVDGSQVPRILLSDAIPAYTALKGTPTAPPGWKVVYTTDPVITKNANAAQWVTTLPSSGTITRVGFINDPSTVNSVAPGQTVTGFTIQVTTSNIPTAGGNIANIAQVFGQTAGDSANTLVYDDSGDQNPDDYHGSTPPSGTVSTGVADSTHDPIDTGNNNSGTTTTTTGGGADNVYSISPSTANSVSNGPNGAPDATGATDNNDDFTNKSALIPPNTAPGSTVNPPTVAFTNTVKNNGTSTNNVSLLPTKPATLGDLPTGSLVTLTYGSLSATYTYNGSTFTLTGTPTGTVGGNPISATNPIRIDNLAAGATANYGVEVKLPAGTSLSTDTGKGFSIPITAFIDSSTNPGDPTVAGKPSNITIDRVYTGFLKMVKESRVLQGTGPAPQSADTNFSSTPKTPAPGNILEYRITYTNISTPQAGTGDIILNANNVVITEDGTTGGNNGNNWALDNDNNGTIDTSNIVGTAKDSGASTINFLSGNPASKSAGDQTGTTVDTDVTKYVDTVTGQVAPNQSRTFGFQRKVN